MKRKMFFAAVNSILILAVMLSFVQLALAVSTADAKEKPELKNDCSLTLHYTHGENEFAGLDVVLYHVADLTNDVQYALSGSFAPCPISVSGVTSQSEWNEIAVTLNSFIVSEKIAPIKRTPTTGDTDSVYPYLIVMAASGILLIFIGAVRRKKRDAE